MDLEILITVKSIYADPRRRQSDIIARYARAGRLPRGRTL